MKLYKKLPFVIVVALSLLIFGNSVNARGFQWIPNYYSYINFSYISPFVTYNGVSVSFARYVYLNLSTLYVMPSNIPILNYLGSSQYVTLQGFDSNGIFQGNVTAYPYANGLLVNMNTVNGSSYSNLTLFFNQVIYKNTYFYANYNYSQSLRNISKTYASSINNYAVFINNLGLYKFYSYLAPTFNFTGCTVYGISEKNSTCKFTFKPQMPYLFYETTTYPYQNVSVDYITQTGFNEYNLYGSNSLLTIINKGILYNQNLNQSSVIPFSTLINTTVYYMLSNSIGAYVNSTIFNASESEKGYISTPFNNNLATIKIYNGNLLSNTTFILIPAYSDSYHNSTVWFNNTPMTPNPNQICSYEIGWFCFLYREQVNNIQWSYTFNTLAYAGYNGITYGITYGASNTPFLNLVMPHYAEMDSGNFNTGFISCGNIYIDAWDNATNTDLGSIPFAVLNCSPLDTFQKIHLLLANKTILGYTYNSFFIYWYNLINQSQFYTPSVQSNYDLASGSNFKVLYTANTPFLIQLSNPLNTGANITTEGGGIWFGYYGKEYATVDKKLAPYTVNAIGYDTQYLIAPTQYSSTWALYAPSIYGYYASIYPSALSGAFGVDYTAENTTTYINQESQANFLNVTFTSNALTGLTALAHRLATNEYTLNPLIQENPNITHIPKPLPKTPALPNSNTSIINNYTNSSLIGNQTAFVNKYGGIIDFIGFPIPQYYLFAIGILLIIVICFMIASGNSFIVIIGLIGLWATGILTAISGNLSLVIVALLITGYYVIANAHKWFK